MAPPQLGHWLGAASRRLVGALTAVSQAAIDVAFVVLVVVALLVAARPVAGAEPVERLVPESQAEVLLSYAPVVRKAAPAVVNIYSKRVVRQRPVLSMFDDPFFRRFFGSDSPFGAPRTRVENSLGSGVIIDAAGTIVTNRHVIADSTEITVVLADRREFDAEIVGSDERTDLAVLRIDPDGDALATLPFRDSDSVDVGDIVLAIGNPFGVGQTVTSGIVSAIARSRVRSGQQDFFIQTDAAINPGNSGGALVDMSGALIGINTMIYSKSGGSLGIGFAVPSNLVRSVVTAIAGGGSLARPWLGVRMREVTSDLAEGLGLERPRGVLIEQVHQAGPGAEADLQMGDVLIAVGGREVNTPEAVEYRLATLGVGQPAKLRRFRRGREEDVRIELKVAPEVPPRDATEVSGRNPFSGTIVANLSPALAEEIDVDPFMEGVVVTGVRRGSQAARLGVRRGDIIETLDGRDIDSVAALRSHLSAGSRLRAAQIRRGDRLLEWSDR